jgi:hypothetical protein
VQTGINTFKESSAENWTRERELLLQKKIADLGLKLEGTRLEKLVQRLYAELEAAGITFKPRVYLADEWSCPDGIPIIGLPFYLADERLSKIEDEVMEGIEAETDDEILGYLRHEAGHAFNYAYKLYEMPQWHQLFGPYSRPYRDDFTPNPFSRNFVRHIAGWYAQKHPDEDFAETFAVWLDPGSNWREVYKDWGCYKKLLYVDRMAGQLKGAQPKVSGADYDLSREELGYSLAEHYRKYSPQLVDLPAWFDGDLKRIFDSRAPKGKEDQWEPAAGFLARHRRELLRAIAYWTGLYDVQVRSLIAHLIARAKDLDLRVDPARHDRMLTDLVAFATTLCMNKLYKGDFIIK